MDRNLSVMTGGSETPAVHTFSGDDNPGPEIHVADADLQQ